MLNYFKGFGSTSTYSPQRYPMSMAALRRELRSARFPQYAHEFRHPPKHRSKHHKPPRPRKPGKPPNPPVVCTKIPVLNVKVCVPKP